MSGCMPFWKKDAAPAMLPIHCASSEGDSATYEYIIVGSGAGGGPLAANLAKAGYRVLLLEAGSNEESFTYQVPAFHGLSSEDVNLSHGPAFNEARYVMDHATPEDRLYLAGHSGGVQRSAVTSRILTNLGYRVIKVMGIAGPSIGQALVDSRYPEAFKVYLNTRPGANQDVVSKVGVVAGAYSMLLDYSVIVPLKYTLGTLGGLVIRDRERAYRIADGFGFSNASIVEVGRQPSSRHQTPMRLSFTDRLVFDAYIRNEFSTAFRDDLERPDRPESDRPHAFPWEP